MLFQMQQVAIGASETDQFALIYIHYSSYALWRMTGVCRGRNGGRKTSQKAMTVVQVEDNLGQDSSSGGNEK